MRVKYSLVNSSGILEKGKTTTDDINSFIYKQERSGCIVEYVKPIKDIDLSALMGIKTRDIIFLCKRMSNLLSSGIVLTKALELMVIGSDGLLKALLKQISEDVASGESLSSSIAKHKEFPPIVSGILSVGEGTGNFSNSFLRLAEHFTRSSEIKSKIRNAISYPLTIMIMGTLTIFVSCTYTLPKMIQAAQQMGTKISPITLGLMSFFNFFQHYWYLCIFLIVALALLIKFFLLSKIKIYFDRYVFKIPIIGQLYKKLTTTDFANNLAILNSSGVKILVALDIIYDLTSNSYLKKNILNLKECVISGEGITAGMSEQLYDVTVIQILRTGEESGNYDQALMEASTFLTKEANETIDSALKVLNPILLLIMSVVTGIIVMAIYSPIINIYQQY